VSNVTSINGMLVERFERIFITATGDIQFYKSEYKYCTLNVMDTFIIKHLGMMRECIFFLFRIFLYIVIWPNFDCFLWHI
jgi:hypothetical protein